jgi:hypothetical protein
MNSPILHAGVAGAQPMRGGLVGRPPKLTFPPSSGAACQGCAAAAPQNQWNGQLVLFCQGEDLEMMSIRVIEVNAAVVAGPPVDRDTGTFEDRFYLFVLPSL